MKQRVLSKVGTRQGALWGLWGQLKKRFLGRRLHFRRRGLNVYLEFGPVVPPGAPAQPAADKPVGAACEYAVTLRALAAVLDKHPASRSVLRHLAALEAALQAKGLCALDALPDELVVRAMSQLETLVPPGQMGALNVLCEKASATLRAHQRATEAHMVSARPSNFTDEQKLQVAEASVSVFMEANERWQQPRQA